MTTRVLLAVWALAFGGAGAAIMFYGVISARRGYVSFGKPIRTLCWKKDGDAFWNAIFYLIGFGLVASVAAAITLVELIGVIRDN